MDETKTNQPADELNERVSQIEELLIQQNKIQKKQLRSSKTHTVFTAVLCVILAAGLIFINVSLRDALQELPNALRSISELAHTAQAEVQRLEDIDLESLNRAISGIASIRFSLLSDSIEELHNVIAPFAQFMQIFGPGA